MSKDNGLRRGEGTIRARTNTNGETVYQARWFVPDPFHGDTQHARTFATQDAAEDHLRKVARDRRDGKPEPTRMTVDQLVADYIERAANRVSDRTVHTYKHRARTMIAPSIGKKKLAALTPLDVQRWIDELGRAGFRPSTIHAATAVLNGALREAAMLGITDRHLGQGVRRPTIGRPEGNVWNDEQARAVLAAVRDDPLYGALYHLALATGMRPGELRAVKWDDLDLDAATVLVRRTVTKNPDGGEMIANRTKSKVPRVIALPNAVVERLRWHRTRQTERRLASDAWQPHNVVFDRGDGHWMYSVQWQRFHRKMCAAVGVPCIRHHDLRHSAATLMMERGIHPKVVADVLGHSEISMTMDRYTHVGISHQRQAIDALGAMLFEDKPSKIVS